MIHAFVEELVRLAKERLLTEFLGIARASVKSQQADGTLTVQCWFGEISQVKLAHSLPDCKVRITLPAEVLLCWPTSVGGAKPGQPGELPVAIALLKGGLQSVEVGNGQPAARENDIVTSGMTEDPAWWSWIELASTALAGLGVPPAPSSQSGKIASGSAKIKLE